MLIWPKLIFLKCGGHSVFQRSALQSCVPAILRLLESWNRWCHSKPPPQVFHRSSRKLSMADYFQYLSVWREITGREGGQEHVWVSQMCRTHQRPSDFRCLACIYKSISWNCVAGGREIWWQWLDVGQHMVLLLLLCVNQVKYLHTIEGRKEVH